MQEGYRGQLGWSSGREGGHRIIHHQQGRYRIIKAIAGHADEDVTDRYVHVSLKAMREVIVRMEAAKLGPDEDDDTAAQEAGEEG
jgi:hypothetical protein